MREFYICYTGIVDLVLQGHNAPPPEKKGAEGFRAAQRLSKPDTRNRTGCVYCTPTP